MSFASPAFAYDRAALQGGIVHLGLGGFHRAHMARYTHDLLCIEPNATAWGIVGAGLRASDQPLLDALAAQNFLYTLIERDADGETIVTPGSIIAGLGPNRGPGALAAALDAARIVSLTVTENGYCLNAATKRLDLEHPDIAADLAHPGAPRSAIGFIAEALSRRRSAQARALTVMSCDNIQHNGDVLRQAVLDFAAARDAGLADWIAANIDFPNTMVDRITPVPTHAAIKELEEKYGVQDAAPVFCERFRQWIIEDRFSDGRPAWEQAGAQFVVDVTPYEYMKLRLLNASHLAIAGLGRLAGYGFVDETMRDTRFRAFMAALMDRETGPTLAPVPGIELGQYKAGLVARFVNPNIKDSLDRINADAPVNYLLDPLRDRLAHNASIELLGLALAAWIKRLQGKDDRGGRIEIRHPLAHELERRARQGGADPSAVLGLASLFGELGGDPRLLSVVSKWLGMLCNKGALGTLEAALAASAAETASQPGN
jgi:fructuronate reductase/mannitol 2-dehydrogenase